MAMRLHAFATDTLWHGKISQEILQEAFSNLEQDAKTTKVNHKLCSIIPLNYVEIFAKVFNFRPKLPSTKSQFILLKLHNKQPNVVNTNMCYSEEIRRVVKFINKIMSFRYKIGEISFNVANSMQDVLDGEYVDWSPSSCNKYILN